jgi:hypothetical protein
MPHHHCTFHASLSQPHPPVLRLFPATAFSAPPCTLTVPRGVLRRPHPGCVLRRAPRSAASTRPPRRARQPCQHERCKHHQAAQCQRVSPTAQGRHRRTAGVCARAGGRRIRAQVFAVRSLFSPPHSFHSHSTSRNRTTSLHVSPTTRVQAHGYPLPDYPADGATTPEAADAKRRYGTTMGSAVNPVLREGNSDRRAPPAVKEFARVHPHRMGKWHADSKTHVVTMVCCCSCWCCCCYLDSHTLLTSSLYLLPRCSSRTLLPSPCRPSPTHVCHILPRRLTRALASLSCILTSTTLVPSPSCTSVSTTFSRVRHWPSCTAPVLPGRW